MPLPSIHDFTAEAADPAHYAALDGDWSLAVADVVASTRLAAEGRHRDVNFVAAAVVAVLSEAVREPEQPAACQFGGDGAIAAVPPGRRAAAEQALAALAHWAATEMDVPLRVGLVPVRALLDEGLEVLVALQDFGNGDAFGPVPRARGHGGGRLGEGRSALAAGAATRPADRARGRVLPLETR
ncbi:conserved protein of unknown function [Azospirillum baldaniorum]|uniref:DUF3095 family protein n=2 Tax=Azospirillum baldaniorum TaxID=1064539 RepID=A0A9P1NMW7_9PROT|nr:conserved protein of unknown function [Azospirillum baldaniorum]